MSPALQPADRAAEDVRFLVLGAGATGGYFGGRLAAAGRDVTFLVRPSRAASLAAEGLRIESPFGDLRQMPKVVTAIGELDAYDLVLLSCKAYDLDTAIAAIAPAVASGATVLPFLNGMRHLEALDAAFGEERVLGGVCQIAATLAPDGTIRHLNRVHAIAFGPRTAGQAAICARLVSACAGAGFDAHQSDDIVHAMWEKWVLLATLAGSTCLMRASIGDIIAAPGGGAFIRALLDEIAAIATAAGHAPRPNVFARILGLLTEPGSTFTASMLRDVEAGGRTEADHVIGDLLARARAFSTPLLALAYTHLKAQDARRQRQDTPS